MSDRSQRPPEDDPLRWAPFGRASDEEPRPAPLWSGGDPAAEEPPPAGEEPPAEVSDPLAPQDEAATAGPQPRPGDPTFSPTPGVAPPVPPPAPAPSPSPPAGWSAPEAPSAPGWPPPQPSGERTWPPAGPHGAAAAGKAPGTATAALVFGVIGLAICPMVCSVAAIVLGVQARQQISRTPGLGGRGQATAGIALGVAGLAFFVIAIVVGTGGLTVRI